jgi:hypothetical protein
LLVISEEKNAMAVRTEKMRVPMQLGSELRIRPTGEISISNPDLELEPSEAVADAVLEYSFDPETREHVIHVLEPLSYKPRP